MGDLEVCRMIWRRTIRSWWQPVLAVAFGEGHRRRVGFHQKVLERQVGENFPNPGVSRRKEIPVEGKECADIDESGYEF